MTTNTGHLETDWSRRYLSRRNVLSTVGYSFAGIGSKFLIQDVDEEPQLVVEEVIRVGQIGGREIYATKIVREDTGEVVKHYLTAIGQTKGDVVTQSVTPQIYKRTKEEIIGEEERGIIGGEEGERISEEERGIIGGEEGERISEEEREIIGEEEGERISEEERRIITASIIVEQGDHIIERSEEVSNITGRCAVYDGYEHQFRGVAVEFDKRIVEHGIVTATAALGTVLTSTGLLPLMFGIGKLLAYANETDSITIGINEVDISTMTVDIVDISIKTVDIEGYRPVIATGYGVTKEDKFISSGVVARLFEHPFREDK